MFTRALVRVGGVDRDAEHPDAPADLRAWAGTRATTIARHRMWLFGLHYLTLDYAMRVRADAR